MSEHVGDDPSLLCCNTAVTLLCRGLILIDAMTGRLTINLIFLVVVSPSIFRAQENSELLYADFDL